MNWAGVHKYTQSHCAAQTVGAANDNHDISLRACVPMLLCISCIYALQLLYVGI